MRSSGNFSILLWLYVGGKSERERRAGERENDVESWAVSRLGQISHNHSDSQLDRRGQAVVVVFVYVCIYTE